MRTSDGGPGDIHVVLLPSCSFGDPDQPLLGIFEEDQARALKSAGALVGVVAVHADRTVASVVQEVRNDIRRRRPPAARHVATLVSSRGRLEVHEEDGLRIARRYRLPVRFGSYRQRQSYWTAAGLEAFQAYLRKWGRPDLVHAHNCQYAGVVAAGVLRRYGIPYVLTEHSSFYRQGLPESVDRDALNEGFRNASRVIVVSEELGRLLADAQLSEHAKVIPNVLSSEFQDGGADRYPPPPLSFLAVGNLIPVKGHAILIEAFAEVYGHSDAMLRIVGEGPERSALEGLIISLGLGDRVKLLGVLSRPEIRSRLGEAHVFVLPSLIETFGVVIIEALAAGRPVVATACGGPNSIVGPGDGVLVAPGDVAALADGLRTVGAGYQAFHPEAIRQRALDRFSSHAIANELIAVYREALEGPGAPGEA